mmetsp:Transcript_82489/g.191640  ORF Transcript_82489/g.191640 Transcript_82489/m.191640 type:complete len:296 (-) Transcript_82489:1324-2211(-)
MGLMPAASTWTVPMRRRRNSTCSLERSASTIPSRLPSMPLTPTTHILGSTAKSQCPACACRKLCAATAPPSATSVTSSSCTAAPVGLRKFKPNIFPSLSSKMLKRGGWRNTVIRISEAIAVNSCCIFLGTPQPLTLRMRSPTCTHPSGCLEFHSTRHPVAEMSETTSASGPVSMPSFAPKSSRPDFAEKPKLLLDAFVLRLSITSHVFPRVVVSRSAADWMSGGTCAVDSSSLQTFAAACFGLGPKRLIMNSRDSLVCSAWPMAARSPVIPLRLTTDIPGNKAKSHFPLLRTLSL